MRLRFALAGLLFMILGGQSVAAIVTLEDVTIPPSGYLNNAAFASGGASFNNYYDATFDFWAGFAASRIVNATTPGYGNQYASFAGGGDGSANYAVGYVDSFTPTLPHINLPAGTRPTNVRITNTTYAGLSMQLGDGILVPPGPGKKFGGASGNDPDWFLLTITGRNAGGVTGTTEFYLADYRFANNAQDYIVNQWTTVDLLALGSATSLDFTLTSSDNGSFGMNTPAYFALDNLSVTTVPEPGTWMLLGTAIVVRTLIRRKK